MELPLLTKLRKNTESSIEDIKKDMASTKQELDEFLAPSAMEIEANWIKIGEKYTKSFFLFSYPRYLEIGWLAPLINLDEMMDISLFYHQVDTNSILKRLRKKIAEVESQIIDREEKGIVRDPQLETARQDIEALRDLLTQAQEKIFDVGVYITIFADSLDELKKKEERITRILENQLVFAKPATFQQFKNLESTMPLGKDRLTIWTPMNTGPASTTFPFLSATLSSDQGILYGINVINNSLVIFDRFSLENANVVMFGKSGAGKSYATKLEILRSLMVGSTVVVVDPEAEYRYLTEAVGGSFFNVAIASKDKINPLDLPAITEDENPKEVFKEHILNLLGLFKVMLETISTEEESLLDRALTQTYAAYDIRPEENFNDKQAPLLGDLETVLRNMEGGRGLAERLYQFTHGVFESFLNEHTTINMTNRLVTFGIRDLRPELRPIAMYIIINFIWNEIRKELKKRVMIIDEAWWLMQRKDGAEFLFGLAKRSRKYFLGITTITQDVEDFLKSGYGKPILTNSSLQVLMKQAPASIEILAKTFNLTESEKQFLLQATVGQGLFFAGLRHVPIKVEGSYTEDQIITSDPAQLLAIKKAKEELKNN